MKRILCLVLIAIMVLSGCAFAREQMKEPVTFYYLRQHSQQEVYDLFFFEGAIGSELREASGHRHDLQYLLALYMQGPKDGQLLPPFPAGSKILESRLENRDLTIIMNSIPSQANEIEITISYACIAKTCMGLLELDSVTVESHTADGQVLSSRTFTNDNLVLEDNESPPTDSSEEAK